MKINDRKCIHLSIIKAEIIGGISQNMRFSYCNKENREVQLLNLQHLFMFGEVIPSQLKNIAIGRKLTCNIMTIHLKTSSTIHSNERILLIYTKS